MPVRAKNQPGQAREWTQQWSPGSRAFVPCCVQAQAHKAVESEACRGWVCGLRLAEHLIFPQLRQTLEEKEAERREKEKQTETKMETEERTEAHSQHFSQYHVIKGIHRLAT